MPVGGLSSLSQLDVSCIADRGLLTFVQFIVEDGSSKMHYDYSCVQYDNDDMSCRILRTEKKDPGNAVQYLDKHNVQCDGNIRIANI